MGMGITSIGCCNCGAGGDLVILSSCGPDPAGMPYTITRGGTVVKTGVVQGSSPQWYVDISGLTPSRVVNGVPVYVYYTISIPELSPRDVLGSNPGSSQTFIVTLSEGHLFAEVEIYPAPDYCCCGPCLFPVAKCMQFLSMASGQYGAGYTGTLFFQSYSTGQGWAFPGGSEGAAIYVNCNLTYTVFGPGFYNEAVYGIGVANCSFAGPSVVTFYALCIVYGQVVPSLAGYTTGQPIATMTENPHGCGLLTPPGATGGAAGDSFAGGVGSFTTDGQSLGSTPGDSSASGVGGYALRVGGTAPASSSANGVGSYTTSVGTTMGRTTGASGASSSANAVGLATAIGSASNAGGSTAYGVGNYSTTQSIGTAPADSSAVGMTLVATVATGTASGSSSAAGVGSYSQQTSTTGNSPGSSAAPGVARQTRSTAGSGPADSTANGVSSAMETGVGTGTAPGNSTANGSSAGTIFEGGTTGGTGT